MYATLKFNHQLSLGLLFMLSAFFSLSVAAEISEEQYLQIKQHGYFFSSGKSKIDFLPGSGSASLRGSVNKYAGAQFTFKPNYNQAPGYGVARDSAGHEIEQDYDRGGDVKKSLTLAMKDGLVPKFHMVVGTKEFVFDVTLEVPHYTVVVPQQKKDEFYNALSANPKTVSWWVVGLEPFADNSQAQNPMFLDRDSLKEFREENKLRKKQKNL